MTDRQLAADRQTDLENLDRRGPGTGRTGGWPTAGSTQGIPQLPLMSLSLMLSSQQHATHALICAHVCSIFSFVFICSLVFPLLWPFVSFSMNSLAHILATPQRFDFISCFCALPSTVLKRTLLLVLPSPLYLPRWPSASWRHAL